MIKLHNALKFITMLFFTQNILTFNLGVAFLKSVSIVQLPPTIPRDNLVVIRIKSVPLENVLTDELTDGWTDGRIDRWIDR